MGTSRLGGARRDQSPEIDIHGTIPESLRDVLPGRRTDFFPVEVVGNDGDEGPPPSRHDLRRPAVSLVRHGGKTILCILQGQRHVGCSFHQASLSSLFLSCRERPPMSSPRKTMPLFQVREAVFPHFNEASIPHPAFESAQRHSRHSCSIPPPAFLPRPSRPPPLRSLRQPLCVLCVFPLRFPCSPLAPKIFSNRWKTAEKFFQSLEKPARIFQPLEKYFPIIGKPAFSRRASRLCRGQGENATKAVE